MLVAFMMALLFGSISMVAYAEDSETDVAQPIVKYIKNSYTSGAYMFEENGVLRYGIPISGDEKEYQWEFIEHDNGYQIRNVASGNTITLSGGIGAKTYVKKVDNVTLNDLWKLDATLPSDEFQNFASASSEYKGVALHIIELTDGYVASEEIGAMLSYGEARWGLFDESEMNFAGVIRDGFCIGLGTKYLKVDGANIVVGTPTSPDDNFIWNFEMSAGGKLIYNLGQKKYLKADGSSLSLVDKANATEFTFYASNGATITTSESALALRSGVLSVVSKASGDTMSIVLASAVSGVLGDLKMEGVYTLSNSWFSMYMLDDNGIPTYGNSNPNNSQIHWEVIYDEATGFSALKNVGRNEYMYLGENGLSFSKDVVYFWKVLRSSNDLYPNAIRFQSKANSAVFLHMENTNGQLECSSTVQPTWGSPHWEPTKFDASATESMQGTTVEADKWLRIKSSYSQNLYFYQTNGGFAYGSVSENDARSHWKFVQDGDAYVLMNRSFNTYVGVLDNGFLTKTEDMSEAVRFKLSKYTEDGAYLILKSNEKEYLSHYLNIKNRDSLIYLSLVSVDIPETRWLFEDAPEEIATNEIVVNNTNLSSFKEEGKYVLDGKTVEVEHYANYVRVIASDGKYLYINDKGKTTWGKFTHDYDTKYYFNYTKFGDNLKIEHKDTSLILKQIATDRKFNLKDGYIIGKQSTISVYASEAKEYAVKLHSLQEGISTTFSIDGVVATTIRSGEASEIKLALHRGNNLIKVSRIDAVDEIVIKDIISNGYQGATLGLSSYEFEEGKTNANIEVDNRDRFSMPNEASGRSYVNLENVTEYAEVTLLNDMNALTLRYSVPDTLDGKGTHYSLSMYVNGKEVTDLDLSSEKTHLYKEWNYTNNPEDGYHHVYFDEVTYVFDEIQPAGTVIRFRRDFDDEADYYALDTLETELIAQKIEQPANSLSIEDFGAIANDGKDDTSAFLSCLASATNQRKEVFIPQGTFEIHKSFELVANNTVIRGAGYWYTTINGIQFTIKGNNISLYSMRVMGDHNTRRDEADRAFVEIASGSSPSNFTLANMWIDHYKVGAWLDVVDQVFISGNRIRYTYADGINLHAGVTDAVVENNSIRSTGDDGLAGWSDGIENTNLRLRYNSIENPWHANCIALYGGTDLHVYNNICTDTAYAGAGINISSNFKPTNFKGVVNVYNNLIIRCGGDNEDVKRDVGGIWFNMVVGYDAFASMKVHNNVILDSTHQGISFNGTAIICSLILEENVISGSGSYGIDLSSELYGKVFLKNNSVSGSVLEDILEGYDKKNAEVIISNDVIEIATDNTAFVSLWSVGGVLIGVAVALAVVLTLILVKKHRREDK